MYHSFDVAVRKSNKYTKHHVGLLMSQLLLLEKEKWTIMRRERSDTDIIIDIIFLIFCGHSCMCLLGVLSSHFCSRSETSSRSSPKNGCQNFQSSSHCHVSYQQTFFFVFYPMSTPTALSLKFLSRGVLVV